MFMKLLSPKDIISAIKGLKLQIDDWETGNYITELRQLFFRVSWLVAKDQTSTLGPWPSSGAVYFRVPQKAFSKVALGTTLDKPKSVMTTRNGLKLTKKFPVLDRDVQTPLHGGD